MLEGESGLLQVQRANQVAALANALRAGVAAVLAVLSALLRAFERNILGNEPVCCLAPSSVLTAAADHIRNHFRANQLRFGEELPH